MDSIEDMSQKFWYLIYSKPCKEQVAYEQLLQQDYSVYLPKLEVKKRLRGQYKTVIEPMFPRYLFIHLDHCHDNWGPIRSTIGVSHLVKFGHVPASVPNQLIELLHARELPVADDKATTALFLPGDNVQVLDGPLAGYEAVFQAQKGADRVIVLLKMAGQFTKVHLSLDAVGEA